jgi:hypothetical protein
MLRERAQLYSSDKYLELGTFLHGSDPGRVVPWIHMLGEAHLFDRSEGSDIRVEGGTVTVTSGVSPQQTYSAAVAEALTLLQGKVSALESEVRDLRNELAERPLVSSAVLHDLGGHGPAVTVPISVVIEQTDEETVATWPETGLYGVGETPSDAIISLKDDVLQTYLDLEQTSDDNLGELAKTTLATLRRHLSSTE